MRVIFFLLVAISGYKIDYKKASTILGRGKRANEGYTGINEVILKLHWSVSSFYFVDLRHHPSDVEEGVIMKFETSLFIWFH